MTDDPFLAPPGQRGAPPPTPQQPVPQAAPQGPAHYGPPDGYPPPPAPPTGYSHPGYSQPGYSQPGYPPNMPPPMPYWNAPKPKTWMNWVAFGCGLGALLTCVSFIPAIVFGHLGLAAAKRGEADKKGFGLAGLIIGYVWLVGFIAYIALIVGLGLSGDLE